MKKKKMVNCCKCKDVEKENDYYWCKERKWKICKEVATTQCLCDDVP